MQRIWCGLRWNRWIHPSRDLSRGRTEVEIYIRTDITNAIHVDGFAADSRGFTNSSRGYTRIYGGFADGITTGSRTGSRDRDTFAIEFARVRESSREFASGS